MDSLCLRVPRPLPLLLLLRVVGRFEYWDKWYCSQNSVERNDAAHAVAAGNLNSRQDLPVGQHSCDCWTDLWGMVADSVAVAVAGWEGWL